MNTEMSKSFFRPLDRIGVFEGMVTNPEKETGKYLFSIQPRGFGERWELYDKKTHQMLASVEEMDLDEVCEETDDTVCVHTKKGDYLIWKNDVSRTKYRNMRECFGM